jgi:hypothetical protein
MQYLTSSPSELHLEALKVSLILHNFNKRLRRKDKLKKLDIYTSESNVSTKIGDSIDTDTTNYHFG